MYAVYDKQRRGIRDHYRFSEKTCLFGCNSGFIPWLLQKQTQPSQGEPYAWHLDIEQALGDTQYKGKALVIDLKPKQNNRNLSLYEILDVWGYSCYDWTPILLRLNGLFVDDDPTKFDRDDFLRREDQKDGPIYEFLYLVGSVSKGQLTGTWNAPPASPTNGALLWPPALGYFVDCIRSRTPGVIAVKLATAVHV